MRYVPAGDSSVLLWLRAELRTAVAVLAVCPSLDTDGLGLLDEPLADLLARDGSVRIVVPTWHDAEAAASVLPGAVVEVAPALCGFATVVVSHLDGSHRAYLGASGWSGHELRQGLPGVLMDQRRDEPAAANLLRDLDAALLVGAVLDAVALEDLLQPVVHLIEAPGRRSGPPTSQHEHAIPTGLRELDQLTGGLSPGHLWVITGRSGAGKSVLALDLARAAALRRRQATGLVLSREDRRDVALRLLSAQARVPLLHLHRGEMTDGDWQRLARRMGEVAERPLVVAATGSEGKPGTTVGQVAGARSLAAEKSLRVVVVDDVEPAGRTAALRDLKALATRHDLTVVAVLQDDGEDGRVDDEAARAADVAVRIDRDHENPLADGEWPSPRTGEADLLVHRHRFGPTAVITVAFQGHYSRFIDIAPP